MPTRCHTTPHLFRVFYWQTKIFIVSASVHRGLGGVSQETCCVKYCEGCHTVSKPRSMLIHPCARVPEQYSTFPDRAVLYTFFASMRLSVINPRFCLKYFYVVYYIYYNKLHVIVVDSDTSCIQGMFAVSPISIIFHLYPG